MKHVAISVYDRVDRRQLLDLVNNDDLGTPMPTWAVGYTPTCPSSAPGPNFASPTLGSECSQTFGISKNPPWGGHVCLARFINFLPSAETLIAIISPCIVDSRGDLRGEGVTVSRPCLASERPTHQCDA